LEFWFADELTICRIEVFIIGALLLIKGESYVYGVSGLKGSVPCSA